MLKPLQCDAVYVRDVGKPQCGSLNIGSLFEKRPKVYLFFI